MRVRRQRQRPQARAPPSAPAARSRTSTAVRSLGRADRVRGPSPGRAARRRRDGPPGDPPLGRDRRPHPHPAHQGGRRRLPLLPRARPRAPWRTDAASGSTEVRAVAADAAQRRAVTASPRLTGAARRRRGRDGGRRPRPGRLRAKPSASGRRRCRPGPGARQGGLRRAGRAIRRCRPPTSRGLTKPRGRRAPSRPRRPRQVLADLARGRTAATPSRHRRRPSGFEAMDTSALEAMVDRGDRRAARRVGEVPCAGEGKAMGALVGAIMKASPGSRPTARLVTALLEQKKG
jgi:hypothetical protein